MELGAWSWELGAWSWEKQKGAAEWPPYWLGVGLRRWLGVDLAMVCRRGFGPPTGAGAGLAGGAELFGGGVFLAAGNGADELHDLGAETGAVFDVRQYMVVGYVLVFPSHDNYHL